MLLLTLQRLRSNKATDVRESEKGRHHLIRLAVETGIGRTRSLLVAFLVPMELCLTTMQR